MSKSVVILGAGISGLVAAWQLRQKYGSSITLHIIDKQERVGGWVHSIHNKGFTFELGPRSLRSKGNGTETLRLIEEIGLQEEVIPATKAAEKRYLWTGGRLQPLPTTPWSALLSPLTRRHLPALLKELFRAKGQGIDESIYTFVCRRFSKEIAETFFDPMVSGIFAGDIKELSVQACFPLLQLWEQEKGSVLKGAVKARPSKAVASQWVYSVQKQAPLFSFRRGMQTLTDRLAEKIDATFLLGEAVLSIEEKTVVTEKRRLTADTIISCLPAPSLGRAIRSQDAMLAQLLESQPTASLAVVSLGYRSRCLPLEGFGYLIPSREKQKVLGVVFDSSAFPEQNTHPAHTRLTVMMGGALHPELMDKDETLLRDWAMQALEKHLGMTQQPDEILINRVKQAIPQYKVGHQDYVKRLRRYLDREIPQLIVAGNFYDGVAVNDCIVHSSRLISELKL